MTSSLTSPNASTGSDVLRTALPAATTDNEVVAQALGQFPVFDGHNDLPMALRADYDYDARAAHLDTGNTDLHTDIPSLHAGGVGAQFWSVYVSSAQPHPEAVVETLEQIDGAYRLIEAYPETFRFARTAQDVRDAWAEGKIASLLGMEGGQSIASSLGTLRMMRRLGCAYMTLTHNDNTPWAASATGAPMDTGLTEFGREVVREMNRIGMLVDLSHVHEDTMRDALAVTTAPVIFSHSSCRGVARHVRNVPDDVLAQLPTNGGVQMINFVPGFINDEVAEYNVALAGKEAELAARVRAFTATDDEVRAAEGDLAAWKAANPEPVAGIPDVVAHIEHAREVAGIDHIGLGGDYDGIPEGPEGLKRVSDYPALLEALAEKGWSAAEIGKLTSGNILRVLEDAVTD
ncbi:dipeptidase [Brevibacterium litoralis]|uniref:dipeptidase n=1 Tax=Brevibacterium litoralis TaxID=3138935 RepID=UPI0032EEF8AC